MITNIVFFIVLLHEPRGSKILVTKGIIMITNFVFLKNNNDDY